jgi:hypothetical protein
MLELATDPVVTGDLPLDPTRPKLPPVYVSPGSTLSPSEQRARRWQHRRDYLRQEISGHRLTLLILLSIAGFFALRFGVRMLVAHLHH